MFLFKWSGYGGEFEYTFDDIPTIRTMPPNGHYDAHMFGMAIDHLEEGTNVSHYVDIFTLLSLLIKMYKLSTSRAGYPYPIRVLLIHSDATDIIDSIPKTKLAEDCNDLCVPCIEMMCNGSLDHTAMMWVDETFCNIMNSAQIEAFIARIKMEQGICIDYSKSDTSLFGLLTVGAWDSGEESNDFRIVPSIMRKPDEA
jgi:hypothetical protein